MEAPALRRFAGPGIMLLAEVILQLTGYQNRPLAVVLGIFMVLWFLYAVLTWPLLQRRFGGPPLHQGPASPLSIVFDPNDPGCMEETGVADQIITQEKRRTLRLRVENHDTQRTIEEMRVLLDRQIPQVMPSLPMPLRFADDSNKDAHLSRRGIDLHPEGVRYVYLVQKGAWQQPNTMQFLYATTEWEWSPSHGEVPTDKIYEITVRAEGKNTTPARAHFRLSIDHQGLPVLEAVNA